jgi:hypothetical protein
MAGTALVSSEQSPDLTRLPLHTMLPVQITTLIWQNNVPKGMDGLSIHPYNGSIHYYG